MSLVYAPKGLIGVLTPQANTTVEPELQLLCPPGVALLSARMSSQAPELRQRLLDYYEQLPNWISHFANAPLGAVASACTGSSYLIGAQAEDLLFGRLTDQIGKPLTNSALAVVAAMIALNARGLALVSPYPAWLTALSQAYWQSRGLQVTQVVQLSTDAGAFHPIYALGGQAAIQGLAEIDTTRCDAILLLGTGTPTLPALAQHPYTPDGKPVLSCNLVLLWHALELMQGHADAPRAQRLSDMLQDARWRESLQALS
jgi:maleate cis-trans isomerase